MLSGDRGGQGVGSSVPIHLFGNVASKNRRTSEPQCGGAPSCWNIIHGWNSSEVQRKVPTCPGSFLVINVCNQGKNLGSACIIICTTTWARRVAVTPDRSRNFLRKVLDVSSINKFVHCCSEILSFCPQRKKLWRSEMDGTGKDRGKRCALLLAALKILILMDNQIW